MHPIREAISAIIRTITLNILNNERKAYGMENNKYRARIIILVLVIVLITNKYCLSAFTYSLFV
jgi:hypothetical protein